MICPNDSIGMHQVKIESHYGQPILLEQCSGCGGIWFDESELFSAKQGEADKIELLDSEIALAPAKIEKTVLKCPRDRAVLFRFNDRYFPRGIILERCPSCNGIWLNRGDFVKFQQARQEFQRRKGNEVEDKKIKDEIEKILASHQSGDTTGVLGRLGSFLSTPMDRNTLLPLESPQDQPDEESPANSALNVIMAVLSALLFR